MRGIFINYRRDEASGMAGRLYDRLRRSFSDRHLFMDVDSMKPGVDFIQQLDAQVSKCDVVLSIIGPHWLTATDENGNLRIEAASDPVRVELATALKRGIPVIPILLEGATMPAEDDLPEDLNSLARRHALELRHTRFAADSDAIVSALKTSLPQHGRSPVWVVLGAAALIAAAATLWVLWPTSPRGTSRHSYIPTGSYACFGGAEYPPEWRYEARCVSYGCNFGKLNLDECLALGLEKGAREVIHGNPIGGRADECWLQNACSDLRPHSEFIDYRIK